MLILGEKYQFTDLEKKQLNKKFDTITTIKYKKESAKDVINRIDQILKNDAFTIIVLNTKAKVDDEIIRFLTNIKFKIARTKFEILSIEHFLEKYLYKCYIPDSNNDLHFLDEIKEFNFIEKLQKSIIDIIAIIFLLPFLCVVSIIVKKKINEQSPGSLYFRQLRVGLQNKEFECIKFRSMYEDAEKFGVKFASANDSRVFPFGEFMRKSRLDEIPQVLNIMFGEMSLIGPRPERKYWIKKDFESRIPYYNQRHIVKPGITGWAQVMYPYGDGLEDAKQKLMYDLYYIKHWNILLELKIIIKTIKIVLEKRGR